jgi:UDP-glucose 4-epimerase
MKILITGSQGLIGSALRESLGGKHEIVEADKKNGPHQNLLNIDSDYFKSLEGIDLIIHLANNARVRKLVKYPELAKENIDMNYNIMNYCVQKRIPRIMMASSRETYGNQSLESCKETDAHIWECESPYTASKFLGESYMMSLRVCYGIKPIIVRLSNVFGFNDPNYRFVPMLFEKLSKGDDVTIFGGGKDMDFTYIKDCAAGIITVIDNFDRLAEEKIPIFNIAYGQCNHLEEVANYLKEKLNSPSKIIVTENYPGEVVHYRANIDKITSLTGWSPKYTVRQGLDEMCDALKLDPTLKVSLVEREDG